jgi:2-dehydro-3-deoxy-L-rhamnonate dehydrogenase (NAD+)
VCTHVQGAHVVLLDMNEAVLKSSVADLQAKGLSASSSTLNVAVEADWERVVKETIEAHRRIDILVQAAGVTGKTGIKTHEVDPANWDFVFAVNARGIFLGCRAVIPAMLAANYGRIVNIASVAGKEGNAGMAAYSASKAAVIGLTKVVGKDYAETGITCNAVSPAVVRTAMVDALPAEQVRFASHACVYAYGSE